MLIEDDIRPENPADQLRIGMFSESFQPVQNGVTTSILTLTSELRALGNHVFVFAPAHQDQRERELNVLRFPSYVTIFNREYPLAFPFVPRLALAFHFNRLKLDVVHTHTPFVLGLTGANLAVSRRVPLVSTFHTLYSQYIHYVPMLPDTILQGFIEHYLPWYYNRCAAIICPSHVAETELRKIGLERPIEVIPTGVPLPPLDAIDDEAKRCAREKIGVAPETPLLLFAGRLSPEKRVDWLLEVFATIHERIPATRMAIAGGGTQVEALKLHAERLQLGASVLFLGPTPRRELDSLYAAADVFCFPSPSETQGLVIGEARAAGAPCVVVDAGGAPETVEDGVDGFRVPFGDREAFARRIQQILEDKILRETLRENARKNACRFTPETMAKRVMGVYEQARLQKLPENVMPTGGNPEEWNWELLGQTLYEKLTGSNRQ